MKKKVHEKMCVRFFIAMTVHANFYFKINRSHVYNHKSKFHAAGGRHEARRHTYVLACYGIEGIQCITSLPVVVHFKHVHESRQGNLDTYTEMVTVTLC